MKKNITLLAQLVLVTGAVFGMVSVAGAQPVGSTDGTDTATTTYTDPCGSTGGAGWTAPGSTPPTGNVAAPINVSSVVQLKSGKLILGAVPCPLPPTWAPTGSKLTVNGTTDTFGFANWGTSYLAGKTTVGGSAPSTMFGSPFTAPALYAKAGAGYSAFVADGGATVYGGLNAMTGGVNVPNGDIRLTGSGHIYENGARVCLETGVGCPASGGGTTTTTTSGLGGSGTTGYLPKFVSGTSLGNSIVSDGGSFVNVAGSINADKGLVLNNSGALGILDVGVRFGGASSGEGVTSNRVANNLEFRTANEIRMSIDNSGVTSIKKLRAGGVAGDAIPVYRMNNDCPAAGALTTFAMGVGSSSACRTTANELLGYIIRP